MPARRPPSSVPETAPIGRRSPCPVACFLDLAGDRWTLLVVRDLLLGRTRFKDFAASPERIPTNILSDRLRRLVASGVIVQVEPRPGAKQLAYALTERGQALGRVLTEARDWGLAWIDGTRAALEEG